MPLWSQVSDATYLQVNFRGKLCFLRRSRRIKLTAAETSEREREAKKGKLSSQVFLLLPPPDIKGIPSLVLWVLCSQRKNKISLSQTGGFKNTLRLSCRNFVPEVYFEQFLLSHEVGRTNLFKYMSHVHEKRFRLLRLWIHFPCTATTGDIHSRTKLKHSSRMRSEALTSSELLVVLVSLYPRGDGFAQTILNLSSACMWKLTRQQSHPFCLSNITKAYQRW